MILFQLVVNVGMVLGVMPITGIPLPFVTHGGASLVSMAIGLGILQSINIRQTQAPSGDARRPKRAGAATHDRVEDALVRASGGGGRRRADG